MNFLAHSYLSGEDNQYIYGNFIGEFVKGKKYLLFPEKIQKGIMLHRKIDTFTDSNQYFRESMKPFRKDYGRYSGIMVDMVFDYFLAKNWVFYSNVKLNVYIEKIHSILLNNYSLLPNKIKQILPILIKKQRLNSYATIEGIQNAIHSMSQYTSLPSKTETAIQLIHKYEKYLNERFQKFMNEIINYIEIEMNILINRPEINFVI